MPTRKQRRRREKGKRHEYEYVYVDDEGNEVEVDPDEDPAAAREARPRASANGKPAKAPVAVKDARGRTLRNAKPPSWRRAAQRAGMFVVVLFLFISLVGKHKPALVTRIGLAAVYGIAAVPFFYWMDRLAYRRYEKLRSGAPSRDPKKKR